MTQTIKSMTVSNYKGIRGEVTLHPNGEHLQILAGPNGAGKSSFIDGIAELFDPKGVKLTKNPINTNTDATEAYAELITDKSRIRRTWKGPDAGKLTAWKIDEDGDELKPKETPREFVLKATGGALFDPQAFIGLSEAEQRGQLLELVELPFDLDELALKRKMSYDNRAEVKREVTALQGQVAGMPPVDPSLPPEEKPSSTILAQLDDVRANNARVDQAAAQARTATAERERIYAETTRLQQQFEASKVAAAEAFAAEQLATAAMEGVQRKDEENLKAQLATADETNAKIRAQAARRETEERLAAKVAEHERFENEIKAIDKMKSDSLGVAEFPLPELSVDDDGITYNGTPFMQVNTAMKRLVAFDLATIKQPDIRLFYIKDGDLLDADSLAAITARAVERGYFLLMERDRDNSGEMGATFSEGQLVSA